MCQWWQGFSRNVPTRMSTALTGKKFWQFGSAASLSVQDSKAIICIYTTERLYHSNDAKLPSSTLKYSKHLVTLVYLTFIDIIRIFMLFFSVSWLFSFSSSFWRFTLWVLTSFLWWGLFVAHFQFQRKYIACYSFAIITTTITAPWSCHHFSLLHAKTKRNIATTTASASSKHNNFTFRLTPLFGDFFLHLQNHQYHTSIQPLPDHFFTYSLLYPGSFCSPVYESCQNITLPFLLFSFHAHL